VEADAPAADATENMDQWMTTFPEGVEVTEDLLTRGQQRFNIYCVACHGYAGQGDGLVNQRALALAANGDATWTAARSLHDAEVKGDAKNPVGRIYDTITNGRGNMGPYKAQIRLLMTRAAKKLVLMQHRFLMKRQLSTMHQLWMTRLLKKK